MKKIIMSFLFLLCLYTLNAQDNRAAILQDLEKDQSSSQDIITTATLKSSSRLFGDKNDLTSVIVIIPSGSVVDVLGADSTYLQVVYEDTEGYIYRRHAVINSTPAASGPVIQQNEPVSTRESAREAQPEPQQQQQVSRFTYLENKYGSSMAAKIMAGKIWKGMTAEMVRDSWGKPQKINRVISGNDVKEEWIFKSSWLYIENDYLVEWGPIR